MFVVRFSKVVGLLSQWFAGIRMDDSRMPAQTGSGPRVNLGNISKECGAFYGFLRVIGRSYPVQFVYGHQRKTEQRTSRKGYDNLCNSCMSAYA